MILRRLPDSPIEKPVDEDYKKMMTWVAIALVASLIAAFIIVEIAVRKYGG
ncbi:MAG TPA: hypothetical protein VFZ98_12840 [Vicinamibacterales bacterium]